MSEPFIGELRCFGFNFAPRGWAQCDGQLLPISQFSALFSLLGTIYGGDGRTTFGLPELRGRLPMHTGSGPDLAPKQIGQKSGNESTNLITTNLPPHNHVANLNATSENATAVSPTGNALALAREDTYEPGQVPTAQMAVGSVTTENTGSATAFSNLPPYLVLNWCIALIGIYPSRN